ncbi:hypothetical protein [Streptomyces sp. NPDC052036]|uniref:hypothetical protein n=1 Tax=Streptomyces sp. NPDC052036 TaxID=3155171 RepID=UPI0034453EE4
MHAPAVTVARVRNYVTHFPTYNLTVNELHTYYVLAGSTPVLVHNCNVTVSDGALDHAWESHRQGGSYHQEGKLENVLSPDIADKETLGGLIQRTIRNGTRTERSAGDPRGGYYITHSFDEMDDPEIGHQGQNGLKLFVDEFNNLKSLAPVFSY